MAEQLQHDPNRTLDRPAVENPSTLDLTGAYQPAADTEPSAAHAAIETPTIPGYTITGEIARGGMGRVLVGRELSLDREVAIKVLLPGADAARFVTESKITAKLPHPNIPPVYALGALADGSPYLAMKYIRGRTLADELKARPNPKAELPRFLQIFEQIAQAVGFAHARGIIHRDLKPANVMVGEFGEVQVMDWGLAREMGSAEFAVPSDDSEIHHPEMTQPGAIMGTPAYMAPEQAGGEPVDARADVFALGGILTAILTGKAVFVGGSAVETIQRAAAGETGEAIARLSACGADAELEKVATGCLAVDRANRPADGMAVARAVAAYRQGVEDRLRAVQGERAAAAAREQEQRKRRRVLLWAAGVIALVLVAGIGVSSWQAVRAGIAEKVADEKREDERIAKQTALFEKEKAQLAEAETLADYRASTDDAVEQLIGSKAELGPAEKAYLEKTLKRWQAFAERKGDDEQTRAIRGEGFFRVAAIWQKLGRTPEAKENYDRALELQNGLVRDFPEVVRYRREYSNTLNNYGCLLDGLGDLRVAESHFRAALPLLERAIAEDPQATMYQLEQNHVFNNLANCLKKHGRWADAEEFYGKALALGQKLALEFPFDPIGRDGLANSHVNFGNLLEDLGKTQLAQEQFQSALSEREKLIREFPKVPKYRQELANNRNNLATCFRMAGKWIEADDEFRKGSILLLELVAEYPSVPEYRQNLANTYANWGELLRNQGKNGESETIQNRAIAVREKLAQDFPTSPNYRHDLAVIHTELALLANRLGQREREEKHYLRALAITEKLVADFPDVLLYRNTLATDRTNYGFFLAGQGEIREAQKQYAGAMDIRKKLVAEFPKVPAYRLSLCQSYVKSANLMAQLGKRPEAYTEYFLAIGPLGILVAESPESPDARQELMNVHSNLGALVKAMGNLPDAQKHYRKSLAVGEKLVADFPNASAYQTDLANAYSNLGNAYLSGAEPGASLAWYANAIRLFDRVLERESGDARAVIGLKVTYSGRAMAHFQLEKYSDANADWKKAIDLSPEPEQPRYRALRATSLRLAGRVDDAVLEVDELIKIEGWNAERLSGFARIYSAACARFPQQADDYAARSIELLKKAIRAKYKDAALLKTDKDFEPLRKYDDFKKLISDLDKPSAPEK